MIVFFLTAALFNDRLFTDYMTPFLELRVGGTHHFNHARAVDKD